MKQQPQNVEADVRAKHARLGQGRRDSHGPELALPVDAPERAAGLPDVPGVVGQPHDRHAPECDAAGYDLPGPRTARRIEEDPPGGAHQDQHDEHAFDEQAADESHRHEHQPSPGPADAIEPDQTDQETDQHRVLVVVSNAKDKCHGRQLQKHEERAAIVSRSQPGCQRRGQEKGSQARAHAEDVWRLFGGHAQPAERRGNQKQRRPDAPENSPTVRLRS